MARTRLIRSNNQQRSAQYRVCANLNFTGRHLELVRQVSACYPSGSLCSTGVGEADDGQTKKPSINDVTM